MSLKMSLLRKALETEEVKELVEVSNDQVPSSDANEPLELADIDSTVIDAEIFIDENGAKCINLIKLATYYVQGYDNKTLGTIFGVTNEAIKKIKASEKFKGIVAILTREIVSTARSYLSASGLKAVTTLIDCMNSMDEKVRLQAATQVLDRIGIKTADQIEVVNSDKMGDMSETELIAFVQKGIKDLLPSSGGGTDKQ